VHKNIIVVATLALASLVLSACAGNAERKAEYQRASSLPPLEMPPELSAPDLRGEMDLPQSYSLQEEQGGGQHIVQVLPHQANVQVLRDRDLRWLQINAEPEDIWARLRNFWAQQGLDIKKDEPKLGVLETQWAENRADVPGDWVTNLVSKVFKNFYSAPTRDMFRMRVERGAEQGVTEIFITHYGMAEIQRGKDEFYETVWQPRPADPELVAEMLNRMMIYFGVSKAVADSQLAAKSEDPGPRAKLQGQQLQVNESFVRTWRRVGIALDRIGFLVEDRDRSAGRYYIRPVDQVAEAKKKGFFSSLFSSKDKTRANEPTARILLQSKGDQLTIVTVEASEGEQDGAEQAMKILQQLETELR